MYKFFIELVSFYRLDWNMSGEARVWKDYIKESWPLGNNFPWFLKMSVHISTRVSKQLTNFQLWVNFFNVSFIIYLFLIVFFVTIYPPITFSTPPPLYNHCTVVPVHEFFFCLFFVWSFHPWAVSLFSMSESVSIFLVSSVHYIPHLSEIIR